MTNPNNSVRIHSRNGGRASVYEANQWAQPYRPGVLSGLGITPAADLNINVGGSQSNPSVVIGTNPAGYKIALDIVAQSVISLTPPASDSKIVAIVAYTNDLAVESEDSTITGSPSSCGLIAVDGAAATIPEAPDEATIRAAITADGATGSQAVYAVVGTVRLQASTTTITDTLIENKTAGLNMLDFFYPIGSYYETSDASFNPNIVWGGAWEEDTAGRVLVAKDSRTFDTVGATGGAEVASHRHWQSGGADAGNYYDLTENGVTAEGLGTRVRTLSRIAIDADTSRVDGVRQSTTYDASTSTLQPYIVISRWHRIA